MQYVSKLLIERYQVLGHVSAWHLGVRACECVCARSALLSGVSFLEVRKAGWLLHMSLPPLDQRPSVGWVGDRCRLVEQ